MVRFSIGIVSKNGWASVSFYVAVEKDSVEEGNGGCDGNGGGDGSGDSNGGSGSGGKEISGGDGPEEETASVPSSPSGVNRRTSVLFTKKAGALFKVGFVS